MKRVPIFEANNKEVLYHGSTEEFDKFDMAKVGASGVMKYGYGIYLTENPDVAKQYTTGKHCHIYKVKAYNISTYADWDGYASDHPNVTATIGRKLKKAGKDSDIEEMDNNINDWTIKDLYQWLSGVLDSVKDATEWFNIGGINGFVANDSTQNEVYVAFDDSELKILGKIDEND